MLRIKTLFALVWLGLPLAAQMGMRGGCCVMGNPSQGSGRAPAASNPVVELSGIVGQVQISPGTGMPYLEVKRGEHSTRVYLGPMRYLIAADFNPKTGQEITVIAYQQGAVSITG